MEIPQIRLLLTATKPAYCRELKSAVEDRLLVFRIFLNVIRIYHGAPSFVCSMSVHLSRGVKTGNRVLGRAARDRDDYGGHRDQQTAPRHDLPTPVAARDDPNA